MTRTLLILRHAKSDWGVDVDDFDRPLKKRGKHSADKVGQWLAEQHISPDCIVSSPAKRTMQTAKRVIKRAGINPARIRANKKIYLAELPDLLDALSEIPREAKLVLLVGHNPGVDELLEYLAGPVRDRTCDGKLMTTAALAQLNMPEKWDYLQPKCAELVALVRPGKEETE